MFCSSFSLLSTHVCYKIETGNKEYTLCTTAIVIVKGQNRRFNKILKIFQIRNPNLKSQKKIEFGLKNEWCSRTDIWWLNKSPGQVDNYNGCLSAIDRNFVLHCPKGFHRKPLKQTNMDFLVQKDESHWSFFHHLGLLTHFSVFFPITMKLCKCCFSRMYFRIVI